MSHFESALKLQKLVFDKLQFERKGFKNEKELKYRMKVQVASQDPVYKVTLIAEGEKEDEYTFLVSLSGFFEIDNMDVLGDKKIEALINKNAVAVLMPYLRSEVSILTAQPETDSVILPLFNINKMLSDDKGESG